MAFDIANVRRDYGDIDAEWAACRRGAALFDFSFMARGRVAGPGALALVERYTGRALATMPVGSIRYALRADAQGHLVADLTIWRLANGAFEVMSGRHLDIADLVAQATCEAVVTDLTSDTAVLALQGPHSLAALDGLTDTAALARVGYYRFADASIDGVTCRVGRLGYTGEPGFEIVLDRREAPHMTRRLAERARPAGFAAADILRIEAGFLLFANEFRLTVAAAECGLAKFCDGAALAGEIKLVCLTAAEAPVRPVLWRPPVGIQRPIRAGEVAVTSACWSPLAGSPLLLGFTRPAEIAPGTPLHDPAGTFTDLRLTGLPYFDPAKTRPRSPWPDH